jgi:hypothetical protein
VQISALLESRTDLDVNKNCPVCGNGLTSEPHVGIVVPLFKSQSHIDQLTAFVNDLDTNIDGGITLTVVVDGCRVSEEEFEKQYGKVNAKVCIISLSKNFGVGPALFAAMSNQNECFTIAFGSDLQEPSSLFVEFSKELFSGRSEIVLGSRISREDPWKDILFAKLYWYLCRKLMFSDVPNGGFDVFGMNKVARKALTGMPECKTNITAQILWLGFKKKYFPFTRTARIEGKSTWSFRKKLGLFLDSFFSFWPSAIFKASFVLLTVASTVLLVSQYSGSRYGSYVFWTLISAIILLQSSVLDRVYENSKSRPVYIIARSEKLKDRS